MSSTLLLLALVVAMPPTDEIDAPVSARDIQNRWEKEMAAFDRQTSVPRGANVFFGSSSIGRWNLRESFPEFVCVNRGFGGSQMHDAARYLSRAVLPLQPAVVILYEGDNDLSAGKSPEQVFQAFQRIYEQLRAETPHAKFVVLGIKPSPSRWKLAEKAQKANSLMREAVASDPYAVYVDTWTPLLGTDGKPDPQYYVKDMLHLSPAGYARWNAIVQPLLTPSK